MKSDLFIECANSVVDSYNLMQESIGSKNRMEYPVVKEVKPREWYEVEVQTHNGDWVNWSTRFGDEQRARDAACNWAGKARFIKVREVME